jgi:hypothetical protein
VPVIGTVLILSSLIRTLLAVLAAEGAVLAARRRTAMFDWVALCAILALSLPVSVAAATFGELEAWCAPVDQGGKPNLCSGYLDTVVELLASPDATINGGTRVCVPAGVDRGKLVTLIRDYARRHPDARDLDTVAGLGQALNGQFPCRGK